MLALWSQCITRSEQAPDLSVPVRSVLSLRTGILSSIDACKWAARETVWALHDMQEGAGIDKCTGNPAGGEEDRPGGCLTRWNYRNYISDTKP